MIIETAVSQVLHEHGLLLLADAALPSVATLVAGQAIRGSWWGHPKSHAIFAAASALADRSDVIAIPLVSNKITFVHRRLWPAIAGVGIARERWQTAGVSRSARALLNRVDREHWLQASGDAARELERRLLVRTEQVHTDTGAHKKQLESWTRWAARVHVVPLTDAAVARATLEQAAAGLAPTRPKLPWDRERKTSRSEAMKTVSIVSGLLLAAILVARVAALQHPSMPPGMTHEEHLAQMQREAEMRKRGAVVMGFDQDKTTHHFRLTVNGGFIQVEANDSRDVINRDLIRTHLNTIAEEFAAEAESSRAVTQDDT